MVDNPDTMFIDHEVKIDDQGWQVPPPNLPTEDRVGGMFGVEPSTPHRLLEEKHFSPPSPNPYAHADSPTYNPSSPTYAPATPKSPKKASDLIPGDDGFILVTPEKWNKYKPGKDYSPPPSPKKEWRKVDTSEKDKAAAKELRRAAHEARRVAAFRASRDCLADIPTGLDRPRRANLSVRELSRPTPLTIRVVDDNGSMVEEGSPSVIFPSSTRTDKDRRAIKQQLAAKKRNRGKKIETRAHQKPIRTVTKSEAAAPINVSKYFPARDPTDLSKLKPDAEPTPPPVPRGTGAVIRHSTPGTTNLDNNAGRLITVKSVEYEIVGVQFWGFLKHTLSSTMVPDCVGIHVAGDKILVKLPYGLVESLGSFLVGMLPNAETFMCCQKYCRSLIRSVDFDTPRDMENAMIYAPYIAMTARQFDREAINRKLSGMLWTKQSLKCLQLGAAASLVMGSLPVACAATVAGAPVVISAGLGTAAAVASTLAIAAGIKYVHKWFKVDEAPIVYHPTIPSSNSTAPKPPQSDKASITITVPDLQGRSKNYKQPDHVKEDAARVTGLAVDGCEPVVFGSNQHNMIAALEKRSCAEPAPFLHEDRQAFCDFIIKYWDVIVNKSFKIPVPEDPELWYAYVAKWVDGCGSSSAKKARYLETARKLADQGITAHTILTPDQLHQWTQRDVSPKLETVLKDASKSPRQILAPPDEFVVLTAPFIKDLTGIVRRAWRASKRIVYSPGMSSKSLADCATAREWDNKVNSDMDAFDLNQGVQTCETEIKICKKYHAPTAHIQLMQANKVNHGSSRLGVKYTSSYVRNTGDPWTTLFNSTLTGFLAMYAYCQARNCVPQEADVKILVGGDDSVILYDGPRIDFPSIFAKLGHPSTSLHVDHNHLIEFLSCRLTHTSTGWNFVPKVGQMIAKLSYSVRAANAKQARSIARGAALSCYDASSGCPPLRAYLDTILRITAGVDSIKPNDEPYKLSGMHTGVATESTWTQLIDVYGYDHLTHETLLKSLEKVTKAGLIIVSPILKMLIFKDSARDSFIYPPPETEDNGGWVEDLTEQGIEPNPGPSRPNHDRRLMVVTAGLKSQTEKHPGVMVVAKKKQHKSNRNNRKNVFKQAQSSQSRRSGGHVSAARFDMQAYKAVLNNPFDMIPVRLGGETMVPSGLATLVTRFAINVTSGGFGSMVFYPIAGAGGVNALFSGSAASPYSYTPISQAAFPGAPSLTAISAEGRIVAAGVRVFSTNNSTADSGLITIGCVPRDVSTSSALISASGFPIANGTATATQGFNEFEGYLSTETYPLKQGATAVYRPQDPVDFTFRGCINGVSLLSALGPGAQLVPFFVVGVSAAGNAAGLFVELVTHIEYTVGSGAAGIVNTGLGNMNSMDSFGVAKNLFGSIYDTTMAGVVGGLTSGATLAGRNIGNAISGQMNSMTGKFFGSSV